MASLMMEYSRMGFISQTIIFQLCVIYTAVTPLIAVLQIQFLPKNVIPKQNKKGKGTTKPILHNSFLIKNSFLQKQSPSQNE